MRVALTHDYLNQRGGAERVVVELARIWPEAPIYTSLYRPGSTLPEFRHREIRTSFLDSLPVDRRFRNLFPLLPFGFRSLGPIDADLVVTSSSGWAHMTRVRRGAVHVVYCHTPARWLYSDDYLGPSSLRYAAVRAVARPLAAWDRRTARRADLYIANSGATAARIRAVYGFDRPPVVHPPVAVDRFRPLPRGERLLVVSRLLPYKRVDIVIEAAQRLGIGLDVVGTGPDLHRLRGLAGPGVDFHVGVDDATVTALLEGCRALCLPGREDFGIVTVEAQAAGKPVVAYAAGGALETVEDGFTGVLFPAQTAQAVEAAIRRCDDVATAPAAIAGAARRFAPDAFRTRILEEVGRVAGGAPAATSTLPSVPQRL